MRGNLYFVFCFVCRYIPSAVNELMNLINWLFSQSNFETDGEVVVPTGGRLPCIGCMIYFFSPDNNVYH